MPASPHLFRFGNFEANLRTKELRKAGLRLRLPHQSFAVLQKLLERPGELISRSELQGELWQGKTFVDFEHGLNTAMNRLREALGDSSDDPRFVETLPRRGYRFIAPVEAGTDDPKNRVLQEDLASVSTKEEHNSTANPAPNNSAGPRSWWRSKAASILGAALMIPVLTVVIAWWPHHTRNDAGSTLPLLKPLTSYQKRETSPAFSPDGSQVVFAWDGGSASGEGFDLYTKVVGSENLLRLTSSPSDWLVPAWSPDGRTIAFLRVSPKNSGVFSVPAIGGPERKLASANFQYPLVLTLSWSPDGKQLAFPNTDWNGTQSFPAGIRIISLENGVVESFPNPPQCKFTLSPVFSPDGKWLAFSCTLSDGVTGYFYMPRQGGEIRHVITVKENANPVTWTNDSERLIISKDLSLWEINKDGGELKPIPFTEDGTQPAVTGSGKRLAFTRGYDDANLWMIDISDLSRPSARQLVSSTRGEWEADISPDGARIVFGSDRSGGSEVWMSNIDGSNLLQLTDWRAMSGSPRWSPNGEMIAFDSRESGKSAIYSVRPESARPQKIPLSVDDASVPTWSNDGRSLYFTCTKGQHPGIYRASPDGGEAILITPTVGFNVQEARDGTLFFVSSVVGGDIRSMNTHGIESAIPNMPKILYPNDWVLASNGIYFIDRKAPQPSIQFFEFTTMKLVKIVALDKEPTVWGGIAISHDERRLIYSKIDEKISDIMLLENYR